MDDIAEETDRSPGDLHPLARDLVRSAGTSGTATLHSHSRPPLEYSYEPVPISPRGTPQHRYVHLDGGYYRIVLEVVAEGTATVQMLVGRTNATVNADGQSADAVAHADLPTHDRRSFLAAFGHYAVDDGGVPPEFGQVWHVGYLEDANVRSSSLVPRPEHEYVRYGDWFVHVEWNETTEDTRYTYELELEHVADSASAFAAAVTETDGIVLRDADLSADQREILDEATGGTYRECADYSEDYTDLLETLRGARYVRYDGTWYAHGVYRRA